MKISGLNYDIVWENKEENFRLLEQQLADKEADLFILPEMFATGFSMNPQEIADRNLEVLSWMQKTASKTDTAICGSASIEENGKFYNRMYFVKPDTTYDYYDKRHLFSYSGEDKIYTAGKERKIINYRGWRILLQVCYDLRFPVFARNKMDYDLVIYVANWPHKRIDAWAHLLKARAIENQAYVFGVNRTGKDGNDLYYPESTYGFFADGTKISESNSPWIDLVLNKENLINFREHYQFLNDQDEFEIQI